MPRLGYKTKEDKIPQGKMKIYFCSIKSDYEHYFEIVSKGLLSKDKNYDYAIWYDEDETEGNEDETWYQQLNQMSMFIVPITNRFFGSKAERELELAIKNKIPVLPLLAEKGIEILFNAKFGDLHALSVAVGFDEEEFLKNLKRFLDTVLVGENLLEQIRNLKEDYIFLSYRKKDREQAMALMKQIHEEEDCEEIAIWYDEYLMPGENFDEYIEDRLRNSKAFVLTVTPHILEDENYIITKEYKVAKEKRESDMYEIFPIEMSNLSGDEKELLMEKYEDLPECVSREDRAAIREWLQKVFMDDCKKDSHFYFLIGLAYLKGINRERDGERAEKLLIKAAEQKSVGAIRKLIGMYQYGDGVVRDIRKQIYWQEVLVDRHRKRYESNKKQVEALEDYICESIELGELYFLTKQYSKACKVYETTLALFKQVKNITSELLSAYIQILLRQIEIKEQNSISKAEIKGLLMKCREIRNAGLILIRKSKNAGYVRDLYVVRLKEADLHWRLGECAQAEKIYEETIENLRNLTFNKENGVYYSDLIHVYHKRGDLQMQQGYLEQSRTDFEEALRLNEEWENWRDSEEVWENFSITYEKLGTVYYELYGKEQLGLVEDYYEKSIFYLKKAMNGQQGMGLSLELVTAYRRLSGIRIEESEEDSTYFKEAEKILFLALEELEGIQEQIEQSEVQLCTGECYADLADIYFEQYKKILEAEEDTREVFEQVMEYAGKACLFARKVEVTIANAPRRQNILNKCYQYLAIVNLYTEENEAIAKRYYEEALIAATNEYVRDDENYIRAADFIRDRLEELT